MPLDNELLFGTNIDLGSISATSNADATNVVYIPQVKDYKNSSQNDRPNISGRLSLFVKVTSEALDAAVTGAVLTIRMYNHTGASSITSSGDQIFESKPFTIDASAANYPLGSVLVEQPLPHGQLKPYFGLNFAVATQNMAAGKVTAWIGTAGQQS